MMKKVLLIPLTSLAVVLALGIANRYHPYSEVKAEEMTTFIDMNADAFSDYTEEKGSFADANATFWDEGYSFNALGNFFRGESAEGWTGSLSLKPWKQYTQYIRFQWGGANNIDNQIKLEIHYGDYSFDMYNDTFAENPLLMNYFKIPDEQFALLDKTNGFDMYIKLVDNRTMDYGFHNFGSLYVNQSLDEVSGAMRYYLNHINLSDTREWKVNNNKRIYNYYLNDARLKEIFLKTTSNADEDFEDVNKFLNNWYIDLNYGNNAADARHTDNLLSNRAIRDGSNMPFNKTGASFFSGWHESVINQGYIASDYPIYRFVSRPFVLGGTGLVSVKMAGRSASLHVIDTETQEDLAWADLKTFSNSGDENRIFTGFNTVTMVRHYINLEAYLGKTIQLAIADVYEDNWAASYFDELVTNYENYPSFDIDVLFQDNNEDKTYSYWFDKYTASTHIDNDANGLKYKLGKDDVTHEDKSPIYEAYRFLNNYYASLRSPDNQFDYAKASNEVRKTIYNQYVLLSDEAKEIVDKSSDLQYNQTFDDEWHRRMVNTSAKIGVAIQSLMEEFETYTVRFNANGGTGEMQDVPYKGEYPLPVCSFIAPEGQEFAGWKISNTGDLLAAGQTVSITTDTEIFAQWKDKEVVKYIVTFNANGGTGEMQDMAVIQGQKLKLPECKFVAPEGKEFEGWIVRREIYQVGEEVDIIANTEIFAKWKIIPVIEETYTVTFSSNGGTGTMNEVTDVSGEYTLPSCDFIAPEGKEFDCWLIDNEKYQPGEKINVNSDVEIKASWKDVEVIPPSSSSSEPDSSLPEESSIESQPISEISSNSENPNKPETKTGCGGVVASASIATALIALVGITLIASKKNKDLGKK